MTAAAGSDLAGLFHSHAMGSTAYETANAALVITRNVVLFVVRLVLRPGAAA
jgi:hypothetical protein